MSSNEKVFLAFEGNDGFKVVLEFDSEQYMKGKLEAAKKLGLWCQQITLDEFLSNGYKGAHVYDMSHKGTAGVFHLDQWRNYLKSADKASDS